MLSKIKELLLLCLCLLVCLPLAACSDGLVPFSRSVTGCNYNKCTVTTSLDSVLGTLGAEYIAELKSNAYEVKYAKDVLGTIGEGSSAEDIITRKTGVTVIGQGGAADGEVGALVLSVLTGGIKLDKEKLSTHNIDGEVLSFTVLKDNTAAVLGVDLGYDASVIITLSDGALSEIKINYVTASGNASLVAKYG